MPSWPIMNLAAGPVETTQRTLRDTARPVLYHYDPAFLDLFGRTTDLLRQVFRTRHDVVIMQGEAVLGIEAAVASLVAPGDRVLCLASGVFGRWFGDLVRGVGGEPIELSVPNDDAIDPEAVRRALREQTGIALLTVVHSETPSGTVNPLREIGAIAREFGVPTVVDTVSGLGGEPLELEEWGIDVAIAGPQKCLGGPPGLSLLAVSPTAWAAMEAKQRPLRHSFLSILDWKDAWINGGRFPYTPSVNLVYGLESVLSQVLEEGIDRHVARHQTIARAARAGVRGLGLRTWASRDEIAGGCVTAVAAPDGLDEAALRRTMRERYGVTISGGYGELAGKLFRLGHMGPAAHPYHLTAQLAILERSLADLGHPVEFGAGVGAALAALADWETTPA